MNNCYFCDETADVGLCARHHIEILQLLKVDEIKKLQDEFKKGRSLKIPGRDSNGGGEKGK